MSSTIYPFARNHEKYPQDNVSAVKPTNNFQGCITTSEIRKTPSQTPTSYRLVDDAVMVKSVNEKTRSEAIQHFSNLKLEASLHNETHRTDYWKGVAVTILGVGIGIGCGPFMPAALPIVGGILGTTLAVTGVWKASNSSSSMNAIEKEIESLEHMQNEWKDPIDMVIAHRKQAGMQGFQYVYNNHLKGNAVHDLEVRDLWLKDFSKLLSRPQDIQNICHGNLLGAERISYAWNSPVLPDIEINSRKLPSSALHALTTQFSNCRSNFLDFETAITNELNTLHNQKNQMKRELTEIKSRWLYPAECLYEQSKQEALYLYENALVPFKQERDLAIEKARRTYHYVVKDPNDAAEIAYKNRLDELCMNEIQFIRNQYNMHPAVLNIQTAYDNDYRMCNFLHSQSLLVVNSYFDQRLRALDDAVNHCKMQIEDQRNKGHHQLSISMNEILRNAENPLTYTNSSIPSVHRNWRLPMLMLEPSWSEVYGQTPRFQPSFRNDISESSWNRFWSPQAFGRFASCPSTSWNQFSRDRSAFPLKQQWFNLHNTVQQHPRTGMFVREIRVPTPPTKRPVTPSTPASKTVHKPAPNVTPGTRESTQTPPSTEKPVQHVTPGTRESTQTPPSTEKPVQHVTPGTRTATGFGSSETRHPTHVTPGTRTATGFGSGKIRGTHEVHAPAGTRRR